MRPRANVGGHRARHLGLPHMCRGLGHDSSSLRSLGLVWGREERGLRTLHLEPPRAWGRGDVMCVCKRRGRRLKK